MSFWEHEVVVAEIKKSATSKYVVSAATRKGRSYVNVREWYCTKADPTFKPAKAGMAIPIKNFEELSRAMKAAAEKVKEFAIP